MNSILKISILIVCLALGISSCVKEIDSDIRDVAPKLVINSLFSTDSLIEISLTKSLSVLDAPDFKPIDNGTVLVYEDDQLLEELQYSNLSETYKSMTKRPVQGKHYRIEAETPGLSKVSGETFIPMPVPLSLIDTTKIMGEHFGFSYIFNVSFKDPLNEENFYILMMRLFVYYQGHEQEYPNNFTIKKSPVFEYESFNVFLGFQAIDENNDIIGSTSNNDLYSSQICFSDAQFNGKEIHFDPLAYGTTSPDSLKYVIQLISISSDYYKFIRSYVLYNSSNDNPFSELVQMYSNIQGGYGIVLGCSSSTKTFVSK
jgi:hypothetical protein